MRKLIAVLTSLVVLGPGVLFAQNPGQRISIGIDLNSVTIRGDTIGVASTVTNLGTSQESLLSYLVDVPSGVINIRTPAPVANWYASTDFRARPMAVWDILEQQIGPGSATPELYFESIGVPGILTYWAGGKFARSADEDAPDSSLVVDPLTVEMITGKTVGVDPWPVDRSPAGLLTRLRSLTQWSCDPPLIWIADSNLCAQLLGDVDQAKAYNASGQAVQARSSLDHYILLLSGSSPAPYAEGVNSSGYWLLKPNAEIIKGML